MSTDKLLNLTKALGDLARMDDFELTDPQLLGQLKALTSIFNFRDPNYREIRVDARATVTHGNYSAGASMAAMGIVQELKMRPASLAPTLHGAVSLISLLDQISCGIRAIIVEIVNCPLFDTVPMFKRKSMNETKKRWKEVQYDLYRLIRRIVANFPTEQLLETALANGSGHCLQPYIVDLKYCGFSEILPKDLQERAVSSELAKKLNEAISPRNFLDYAPDGNMCSLCLVPTVKEEYEFIIVDACNHLFCVSCLENHFRAQHEGFCPVEGCRKQLTLCINKSNFLEYKNPETRQLATPWAGNYM